MRKDRFTSPSYFFFFLIVAKNLFNILYNTAIFFHPAPLPHRHSSIRIRRCPSRPQKQTQYSASIESPCVRIRPASELLPDSAFANLGNPSRNLKPYSQMRPQRAWLLYQRLILRALCWSVFRLFHCQHQMSPTCPAISTLNGARISNSWALSQLAVHFPEF